MPYSMPAHDWIEILLDSAKECAETILGCTTWVVKPIEAELPDELAGVYIPLVSDDFNLQLGLIAEVESCQNLARALLGIQSDGDEDTVEALHEIIKVIATGVKNRAFISQTTLKIGLPLFVEGYIHITDDMDIEAAEVNIDSIRAYLLVVHDEDKQSETSDGFIHHHLSRPFPN